MNLIFKRKRKREKRKTKTKKEKNDLRSLWTIPEEFIIFIPDAISLAIFIIILLGIASEWLLINAVKSVLYNYSFIFFYSVKFMIRKNRKERILWW